MYTPKQTSEMLNIPPSTLRRYAKDFANVLSSSAREKGRKRQFDETDIMRLKQIRSLYDQGKSTEEVGELVSGSSLIANPGETLQLIPGISNALATHDDEIRSLKQYLQELAEWESLGYFERRRTPRPKPPA